MRDCGKRAITLALQSVGINELPKDLVGLDLKYSNNIREVANFYRLKITDDKFNKEIGNSPVVVIYKDDFRGTNALYHTVFMSDFAPLYDREIHTIIYGWESLRK